MKCDNAMLYLGDSCHHTSAAPVLAGKYIQRGSDYTAGEQRIGYPGGGCKQLLIN